MFSKSLKSISLTVLFVFIFISSLSAQVKVPDSNTPRSEVPKDLQWRLSDIFATDKDWETAYEKAQKDILKIDTCRGNLAKSAGMLAQCMKRFETLASKVTEIEGYSKMRYDGDQKSTAEKSMFDRGKMLSTDFGKLISFLEPELIKISPARIKNFMATEKSLKIYDHYFDSLKKKKLHVLSDKEEKLLAAAQDPMRKPMDLYETFFGGLQYGSIKDESGKKVELNVTKFGNLRYSPDRRVREENARMFFATMYANKDMFSSIIDLTAKRDIFYAQARKYDSSLDAAFGKIFFPKEVYAGLVGAVNENLKDSLNRYFDLKKKIMKVDSIKYADIYVSLIPSFERKYTAEEGFRLIEESLKPLGLKYMEAYKHSVDPKNGWLDLYANKDKYNGAYATATWNSHPFILHNFEGTYGDVETTAHELGHAINMKFIKDKQPYIYFDNELVYAEVASTANELLLLDYMIKNAKSKEEKLYFLNARLNMIKDTLFTQVRFSEFENGTHMMLERKEALSGDKLSDLYGSHIKKYYGPAYVSSREEEVDWARIGHFFFDDNFYVWKYAVALSASVAIMDNVLKGTPGALDKYIEYLHAGMSGYTPELLKKCGVDLNKKETYLNVINLFRTTLDEFEKIYFSN